MRSEYSSSNSHVAAACKGSKGDASLASGRHHYRVNTPGDRGRDGLANDRLCVHRITHRTTDGRHGSKDVVLIMPSGWTATSGSVCSSQRCKTTAVAADELPLCRQNKVKSRETDPKNGYQNPIVSF